MKSRHYDPVIGWLYSIGPVGFAASNPIMFNSYAYAINNPYSYIDPDGREPVAGDEFDFGYSPIPPLRHQPINVVELNPILKPHQIIGPAIALGILASIVGSNDDADPEDWEADYEDWANTNSDANTAWKGKTKN